VTLFEPLFIAVLVALVTGVFVGAFRWRRGNRSGAIRLLKQLCLWVTVYMTIDITVGLASSRDFHKAGDSQCYDDWCNRQGQTRLDFEKLWICSCTSFEQLHVMASGNATAADPLTR